jgi:hypothetical protein
VSHAVPKAGQTDLYRYLYLIDTHRHKTHRHIETNNSRSEVSELSFDRNLTDPTNLHPTIIYFLDRKEKEETEQKKTATKATWPRISKETRARRRRRRRRRHHHHQRVVPSKKRP